MQLIEARPEVALVGHYETAVGLPSMPLSTPQRGARTEDTKTAGAKRQDGAHTAGRRALVRHSPRLRIRTRDHSRFVMHGHAKNLSQMKTPSVGRVGNLFTTAETDHRNNGILGRLSYRRQECLLADLK